MFLYQTHQRPKRQKYHLRQNSLRLKTSQERKGTLPVDRGRQQTRLLWRRRHFHGQHNNIQDPDYKKRTCDISMPGYVSNVLSKFQHDAPKHPQHNPSRYVTPVYGAKTQYATTDETPPLTAQQCLTIQKVTGSFMYYARAVDPTVLMPLNDIATEQTKVTEKTQASTNQLLDYLATHPDATIRYHASDMILHIHSDASYLSVSNARSRLGGLFFLGNKSPEQDTLNGSILNVASVIKNVIASAAESEVGACFHNAQSGAPLRVTLTELGHNQPRRRSAPITRPHSVS
jgi:hypothetical protein